MRDLTTQRRPGGIRLRPLVVLLGVVALLLLLNVANALVDPHRVNIPELGVNAVITRYGFPVTACYSVRTETTAKSTRPGVPLGPGVTAVRSVYNSDGDRVVYKVGTDRFTFNDGSTFRVLGDGMGIDIAVGLVVIGATLALCRWWAARSAKSARKQAGGAMPGLVRGEPGSVQGGHSR